MVMNTVTPPSVCGEKTEPLMLEAHASEQVYQVLMIEIQRIDCNDYQLIF